MIEIISNPVFGLATTIISIVIGIIVSHWYYGKGKKEGAVAAETYKLQLQDAKKEIIELNKKVEYSVTSLIQISRHHDIDTKEIVSVLKTRAYADDNDDKEILQRFLTLFDSGSKDEARNYLTAISERIKDERYLVHMNGYLKIMDQQFEEALNLFQTSSACPELYLDALLKGAVIFKEELKDTERALQCLLEANKEVPDDTDIINNIASFYTDLEMFDLAIEKLKQSDSLQPDNPDTLRRLGNIYLRKRNFEAAIETANRALELGCGITDVGHVLGGAYYEMGQFARAKDIYIEILNKNLHAPVIYANLASCYIDLGDLLAAERVCKQYIQRFPAEPEFIFDRFASLMMRQGREDEVIELAKKCDFNSEIRLYSQAIVNLGFCYCYKNDFEAGKDCFDKVLMIVPAHKNALLGLAYYFMYSENKNLERAAAIFEGLYKTEAGRDVYMMSEYAELFIIQQRYQQAIAICNEALSVDGNNTSLKQKREKAIHLALIHRNTFKEAGK